MVRLCATRLVLRVGSETASVRLLGEPSAEDLDSVRQLWPRTCGHVLPRIRGVGISPAYLVVLVEQMRQQARCGVRCPTHGSILPNWRASAPASGPALGKQVLPHDTGMAEAYERVGDGREEPLYGSMAIHGKPCLRSGTRDARHSARCGWVRTACPTYNRVAARKTRDQDQSCILSCLGSHGEQRWDCSCRRR